MELRTMVHVFNLDLYQPVFVRADTSLMSIMDEGKKATIEVGHRRNYYYIFTILVAFFCVMLVLKIKEIERK